MYISLKACLWADKGLELSPGDEEVWPSWEGKGDALL